MHKGMFIPTTVLVAALYTALLAYAEPPRAGFGVFVGYKNLDISNYKFPHDTHPDDSFLPRADIHGSAGTTRLGGHLHFGVLGGSYTVPLSESISFNFDLGALIGGGRDRHKNDNDSRPDANGAFVYTKANFGVFAAVGASYHIQRFYLGGEAQLAGVFVDSGWDRFGSDESQHLKFEIIPSGGPKVGYMIDKDLSVEGTVQVGPTVNFGVQFRWMF